ncbi:MAG: CoB--CoM heterodisulfide reductase iron-sulfur subunit B family protein [Chloroflexi bacterium]|nr:CoB--CoM heterodisulfide reductase iron-sulfur subunit B family protein [Chloroflexota bacterium]
MKVSYYPGCSLDGTAREYGESVQTIAGLLDVELAELEDWTCCGASSAHATSDRLATALPARNMELADKAGLDLVIPCAACYQRLKAADKELRAAGDSYKGDFKVKHLVDFLWEDVGEKTLTARVKKPLSGLSMVCYYGCLITRPPRVTDALRPDDPRAMDNILKTTGAEVRNWSFKTECCGGSLMFTQPAIAMKMTERLLAMAREAGAECIATGCPVCLSNLDMMQSEISRATGKSYGIPIFYVSELLGLAFGQPAGRWLKGHLTDTRPLLRQKGLL